MDILSLENFRKLNDLMALRYLVDLSVHIENSWDNAELKPHIVAIFKSSLFSLQDRTDPDLKQISRLALKVSPGMNRKHLLALIVPIERKYTRGLLDHEFLVEEGDLSFREEDLIPLTVILDNVRSAFNIGSIFRTSECLGVTKIHLCGYTGTPDEEKVKKTAMGTDRLVAWEWNENIKDSVKILLDGNIPIIALETVKGAPDIYEFSFPKPCALLLGNERYGLDLESLSLADAVVRIPINGRKNSLNIATAFGVTGFEIKRQWCS
ncbi:MAG: RNA methyltransferase [Oligoflexales bacterium]|nr:RNA methyltransferase [Oligoflexales bacterium]